MLTDGPRGSGRFGWLLWLLLIAVLATASAFGAWWYRNRLPADARPEEPDLQPGTPSTALLGSRERNTLMQTFGEISGVDPLAGE
jgi:hypothetical protein